jgi:hypothetical protein
VGGWTLIIQGVGPHHRYEREGDYRFKRDAEGHFIPLADNADRLARTFLDELKTHGHQIVVAQLQVGPHESLVEPEGRWD